jgi:hypothetical protein
MVHCHESCGVLTVCGSRLIRRYTSKYRVVHHQDHSQSPNNLPALLLALVWPIARAVFDSSDRQGSQLLFPRRVATVVAMATSATNRLTSRNDGFTADGLVDSLRLLSKQRDCQVQRRYLQVVC